MPREEQRGRRKDKVVRSSIGPYNQLDTIIILHAVCITEPRNDTGQEKGNCVNCAVCAEVDEHHNIELGILEGFPDVFGLESHFLVCVISRKPHDTDFSLSTGEAP